MNYSLTHKSKQFFWLLIKLSIVFGCGYFIYLKLTSNNQLSFSDFLLKMKEYNVFSLKNCIILLFLSFTNWFLEIIKWKTLASFSVKTSKTSAAIQSLASLTASLITPNRIGEYGAKALYFEKSYRKKILNLNLIGNLHQLLATLFFGVLGLIYFVDTNSVPFNLNKLSNFIIFIITGTILLFFLWKYLFSKKQIFKNYKVSINKLEHSKISALSFLRYLVFSNQFYFLILLFNIEISYIDAISAISTMYLISSFIPMLSIFDAVLKGTVAIFIFNYLDINAVLILCITTLMWFLNFVIPAIIGSYFVLTFKPKLAK